MDHLLSGLATRLGQRALCCRSDGFSTTCASTDRASCCCARATTCCWKARWSTPPGPAARPAGLLRALLSRVASWSRRYPQAIVLDADGRLLLQARLGLDGLDPERLERALAAQVGLLEALARSWSRCPAGCRRRFRCGVPDAPPADRRTAGAAAWRGLARAAAGLAQPALRLCGAGRKPARRAGQLRRQLRCLGDRQRQGQRPGQRSLRPGKPAGLPAVDGLPLQPRLVLRRHRAVRIQDHRDAIAAGEAGAGRRGRAEARADRRRHLGTALRLACRPFRAAGARVRSGALSRTGQSRPPRCWSSNTPCAAKRPATSAWRSSRCAMRSPRTARSSTATTRSRRRASPASSAGAQRCQRGCGGRRAGQAAPGTAIEAMRWSRRNRR